MTQKSWHFAATGSATCNNLLITFVFSGILENPQGVQSACIERANRERVHGVLTPKTHRSCALGINGGVFNAGIQALPSGPFEKFSTA
jgi:hypothetical protein